MLQGQESLQMYKRGITVLQNDTQRMELAQKSSEKAVCIRHTASAWASIADLFMTDLCDEA